MDNSTKPDNSDILEVFGLLTPEPALPFCRFGHPLAIENGWCKVCSTCKICQKLLTPTEYFWCIREGLKEESEPVFEHPGCYNEMEKLTLQSDSIKITNGLFAKLNASRLLIEPLEDLNIRTNENDADIQTQRWMHLAGQGKTHDEAMEYYYVTLRRMESACATLSLAVSKARRAIETDIAGRDRENYQKAQKERKTHEVKAPHTYQAKITKQISKEEKFLETYMRQTGLDRSDAMASLEQLNKAKQARAARATEASEATGTVN